MQRPAQLLRRRRPPSTGGSATSKKLSGPLHGIPVVVKDQAETKGLMTTFGSTAMDGYVPEEDATAIAKLKAAGAIILAKSTMPDFATSWFGFSSKSGETKNPVYCSTAIPAAPAAAPARRSPPISRPSASARTLAARSGCRPASATWSASG